MNLEEDSCLLCTCQHFYSSYIGCLDTSFFLLRAIVVFYVYNIVFSLSLSLGFFYMLAYFI